MKGLRQLVPDPKNPDRKVTTYSHGMLVWRTLDRGHACAVCSAADTGLHEPGPIKRGSAR